MPPIGLPRISEIAEPPSPARTKYSRLAAQHTVSASPITLARLLPIPNTPDVSIESPAVIWTFAPLPHSTFQTHFSNHKLERPAPVSRRVRPHKLRTTTTLIGSPLPLKSNTMAGIFKWMPHFTTTRVLS